MDSIGFLLDAYIPMDAIRFLLDSYGFYWIRFGSLWVLWSLGFEQVLEIYWTPMDSIGILLKLNSYELPIGFLLDSYRYLLGFYWIPMNSIRFLLDSCRFYWVSPGVLSTLLLQISIRFYGIFTRFLLDSHRFYWNSIGCLWMLLGFYLISLDSIGILLGSYRLHQISIGFLQILMDFY